MPGQSRSAFIFQRLRARPRGSRRQGESARTPVSTHIDVGAHSVRSLAGVHLLFESAQEIAVARLLFTCPNTSRKASTGVEMDVQGLRQYWKLTLKLDCPHCDEVHDVCVREAYLDSAVEGLEPTGVQRAMVRRNADRARRSAAPRTASIADIGWRHD
jgi:hypothetical protein